MQFKFQRPKVKIKAIQYCDQSQRLINLEQRRREKKKYRIIKKKTEVPKTLE